MGGGSQSVCWWSRRLLTPKSDANPIDHPETQIFERPTPNPTLFAVSSQKRGRSSERTGSSTDSRWMGSSRSALVFPISSFVPTDDS